MSNDDVKYLRNRLDAIHEMLVESKTEGKETRTRVEAIEEELKPIKGHVALVGAVGKIGSGLVVALGGVSALLGILHKLGAL